MPLPSFVATGTLNEVLGEVASNELVQDAASRAIISVTSNWPSDFPLVWDGEINWLQQPVFARVNNSGEIVNEDGGPLRLLARHDDLVTNLQWSFAIDLPPAALPPKPGGRLRKWTIDAVDDGQTLNLATAIPMPSVKGTVMLRGPQGLSFGGFELTENGLIQPINTEGDPMGNPVEMTILDITAVDGGTPSSSSVETVDGGAP